MPQAWFPPATKTASSFCCLFWFIIKPKISDGAKTEQNISGS